MKSKESLAILGCGWLGTSIGNSLSSQGYHVFGSTTTSDKLNTLSAHGIQPFLIDIGNHKKGLPGEFINAEWLILCTPPAPIAASLNWLTSELAKRHSGKTLMISSTAVYPHDGGLVKEENAIHIKSPHSGVDILDLENAIRSSGPATILRLGGLYGPGRNPGKFLSGKKDIGQGNAPVNLIHLDDVVEIVHLIIQENVCPEILNAVAPGHPSRQQFYTAAAQYADLPLPEFDQKNRDGSNKMVDSSKLINQFSYQFIHPDPLQDILSGG